jgi:hypothetical protein
LVAIWEWWVKNYPRIANGHVIAETPNATARTVLGIISASVLVLSASVVIMARFTTIMRADTTIHGWCHTSDIFAIVSTASAVRVIVDHVSTIQFCKLPIWDSLDS